VDRRLLASATRFLIGDTDRRVLGSVIPQGRGNTRLLWGCIWTRCVRVT